MRLSVVIRAKDDAAVIGETLRRIRPAWPGNLELIGIDSGSRDATVERLREHVDRLFHLPAARYRPGPVLNFGAEVARGDIVVYLNSDCTPTAPDWLEQLVGPILRGEADATFGRQDARPDAWLLVAKDNQRAFGDGQEARRWHHIFSVAVAAFRRDVLLARPFPDLPYSEDLGWAWANRRRFRIRYAPGARVLHSHNYPPRALWRRFRGEGAADARIFSDALPPNARLARALLSAGREVLRDWRYCAPRAGWRDMARAVPYRLIQRVAYWRGLSRELRLRGEGRPPAGTRPRHRDWGALLEIREELLEPRAPRRARATTLGAVA